jgi:hypothetical protein
MRISDLAGDVPDEKIDLRSENSLALGYEAGHALGFSYSLTELPDERVLHTDLVRILKFYRTLTFRGGLTPSDTLLETAGTKEIEEARRYNASRRVERNRRVRKAVLDHRKPVCEACGLDPGHHYNLNGSIPAAKMPVEVHHLAPLSSLVEGERVKYSIPEDFAVLCPTCHRVVHLLDDPTDIAGLRERVSFGRIAEII